MRSKIHKIHIILFCIFVSLVWTKYPVFAQTDGPQPSGNPQQLPPTPPTVSPASTKQLSYGTTTTYKYSTTQQDTQDRNSLRTSDIPQRSIPDLQPTAPSPIEIEFQERMPVIPGIAHGQLTQFGYAFFTSNISTYAPVYDVPVESHYVLGPGDELRITIWGTIENTYSQTVDRYGRIYLPTIGPIRVWGLTFSEAEKLIREHLSHYYKGFQSSITMGQLRTIKVYVVGEVNKPGSYDISALSTLINALFASGGPSRIGSLRNIELKRNHHTVGVFDFYDFLLKGNKSRDFRMESGDVIFVPPIGSVAGIMGQVRRPAIYEIKDPIRVSGFIEMAGGQVPQSYLKRIQVIRIKPNAEREVVDIDLTDTKNGTQQNDIEIRNGDLVIVFPTDPLIYNTCTLEGTVKYPGEYEVKPGMRLSQLLTPDALLPNAYLDKVEIVRFKEDLKADVIHINLKKIW
ncbi:MAG: SLBB domain-containing protein, partial [Candidatus Brocadiaceae bacterium]|nr:SLBB domain-containing protein [Candidatus Brocadiaceae bacterium]